MKCPYCNKEFSSDPVVIASGEDFEQYLCDQINTLSSVSCEKTKASGDQGVALLITLKGGARVAVQCKLYTTPVGNDAVQQVIAGKIFYKCDSAMVVTNNTYTSSAHELAKVAGVALLNYREFRTFIDKLNGSYETGIMNELESYLALGDREELFGKELRYLIDAALERIHDVREAWKRITEITHETIFERHTNICLPMNFAVRWMIFSTFRNGKQMAEHGIFGNGLMGAWNERNESSTVLPLTDERKTSIDEYIAWWDYFFDRFKMNYFRLH